MPLRVRAEKLDGGGSPQGSDQWSRQTVDRTGQVAATFVNADSEDAVVVFFFLLPRVLARGPNPTARRTPVVRLAGLLLVSRWRFASLKEKRICDEAAAVTAAADLASRDHTVAS